jgi:quercetin dioxygenase-like cupin family protein
MMTQALPSLEGNHLKVTVVEVVYAPGGSSNPHSHACPVVGYVAQGAIRYQVKGEAETIYKTGDSFYEAANGVHQVSANASGTEPAKLIAYFLCDHDTPLSVVVPEGGR